RAVERVPARLPARRHDAQLPADALGEGGAALDPALRRRAPDPRGPQQPVQPGRAGPEQLRRDPVGVREVRPPLLPAAGARHGAVHVTQGRPRQVRRAPLRRPLPLTGARLTRRGTAPPAPSRPGPPWWRGTPPAPPRAAPAPRGNSAR